MLKARPLKAFGRVPGKRSVVLGVRDDSNQASPPSNLVEIGNVTIPANHLFPLAGIVVEVEYLYAFPGGSLFQPVYKGPRSDKHSPDTYNSLKFKAANGEAY